MNKKFFQKIMIQFSVLSILLAGSTSMSRAVTDESETHTSCVQTARLYMINQERLAEIKTGLDIQKLKEVERMEISISAGNMTTVEACRAMDDLNRMVLIQNQ